MEKLARVIDFECFRSTLEEAVAPSERGRGRLDAALVFKFLLLQRPHNLSDEQAEFQINDRASFDRFLRLHGANRIPD